MKGGTGQVDPLQAKQMAGNKIWRRDYTGARALIQEALNRFPDFEHCTEMLTVCKILCVSDINYGCGIDWYWVLQLFPSVETAVITEQYQKLVSLLKPNENDFPGTNLALKLLADAYSVLSDSVKRSAFDSKRSRLEEVINEKNPELPCSHSISSDNDVTLERNVFHGMKCPSRSKRLAHEACIGSGVAVTAVEANADRMRKEMICDQEAKLTAEVTKSKEQNFPQLMFEYSGGESYSLQRYRTRKGPEELKFGGGASLTESSCSSMNGSDNGRLHVSGIQNWKLKWSSKDFASDQVWAIYDGSDAMPRTYAKVNAVVSLTRVRVTFLESHPTIDEEIQWAEESLPIVCGIFRSGSQQAILETSRFSHLVRFDQSSRGSFYKIFPRQGEIWARYKKWDCNWRSSDFVGCQYRIVEIVSDFSEESGLKVCSLIEVPGRLTFFHRQLDRGFTLTTQLSRVEMLGFSHRIPAFAVLGVGSDTGVPTASWHLEPDALPPKLVDY